MMVSSLLPSLMVIFLVILCQFLSITGRNLPWNHSLIDIEFPGLRRDAKAIDLASRDFGKIVNIKPNAVLYPSSVEDIVKLVKLSYTSTPSFRVAGKGCAHSIRGQAMAVDGVVVEMTSLNYVVVDDNSTRIKIFEDPILGFFVDVGAEQLWIDVLNATLKQGLLPVSWTDYLYLTVGGTLSNAGISGQTFRYGPQISNVYELDVITGKGEFLTCSEQENSELFYAVLGGLGQFGIITRARIRLDKAPTMVKWVKMIYYDFSVYSSDQEKLISLNDDGLHYVEGSVIMDYTPSSSWKSWFSPNDVSRISSLLNQNKILYCIEAVTTATNEGEVEKLFQGLSYVPEFIFKKDAAYPDFLNRVRTEELALRTLGLWDVPHPWLNLFVPKSRIVEFNQGVFVDIIHKQNRTSGPLLVYPTKRTMWDDRMSAVIPDGDIFYIVGLLFSAADGDWKTWDAQNREILDFCKKSGIEVKEYLSNQKTKEEWIRHFGWKWATFVQRKTQFDPKMILSPGQNIFN